MKLQNFYNLTKNNMIPFIVFLIVLLLISVYFMFRYIAQYKDIEFHYTNVIEECLRLTMENTRLTDENKRLTVWLEPKKAKKDKKEKKEKKEKKRFKKLKIETVWKDSKNTRH